MEHLRGLLLSELAAHAAQASDRQTTTGDLTGQTDVDSVLEREIAEASAVRAADAIADIEQALDRLDKGTYGTCERCDAPIPFERLEAIPHAREVNPLTFLPTPDDLAEAQPRRRGLQV